MSSESDLSDVNENDIVPQEIREAAKTVTLNLLPEKSKRLYTAAYNAFKAWRKAKGSNYFCEEVMIVYFSELANNYSPPSLWSTYSMLKSTVSAFDKIDISTYKQLLAFLKRQQVGYRSKKSLTFTKENISIFLNNAPDKIYLCDKVILIFGIAGGLRREEFVNILVEDVRKLNNEDCLLVNITKTKTYIPRSFTITGELFQICWKYMETRPAACKTNRFFIRFANGISYSQPIGINKFASLPKCIASFLNLSDANSYTGHSFRRTSATLLVDAGADLATLQRHGGWKSATVAQGYIADSVGSKKRICEKISSGIIIKKAKTVTTEDIVNAEVVMIDAPSTSGLQNNSVKVSKSDDAVEVTGKKPTISKSVSVLADILPEQNRSSPSKEKDFKAQVFYHPDMGLHAPELEENKQVFIFNNCNVTINSSNILNSVMKDKSVQTD